MANAAMVCLTDIHLLTSLCSALWVLQPAVLGLHGTRGQPLLPVQYGTHTSKREKRMLRNVLNIPGWPYICHQVFWFDSGLTTAGFSISFFLIPQCLYFQLRQDVQSIFPPIYALVHAVIYKSTSKGGSVEVVGQTS